MGTRVRTHNRIEECEMHAEVERSAGAPASLWLDEGWTVACLPPDPMPLERKGSGAQPHEVSLSLGRPREEWCCARNHLGSPTPPLRSNPSSTLAFTRARGEG